MTDVMTESVSTDGADAVKPAPEAVDDQMVGMLIERARAVDLQLTGEGGLL